MPKLNRNIFSKLLKTGIFFVLSKGTAFIAPILLVRFVNLEQYGVVEYSYSMGSVLAIVCSLGFAGSYPYFILKKKESDKKEAFLIYSIPIAVLAVADIVAFYGNILGKTTHFIILFTLIFSIQRIFSSKFKTEDKGYIGVIFDSGYYFILALALLTIKVLNLDSMLAVSLLMHLMEMYLGYLCCLMIWNFLRVRTTSLAAICKSKLPIILRFSYKLIISGFIVFWLTSSARIYVKWFLGYEAVGIYSFYFRIAGISNVIYQFLYIAFFKRLYIVDSQRMDKYYSTIIVAITACCSAIALLLPLVVRFLKEGDFLGYDNLYYMLCLQMPMWVGFALGEGIIGRENIVNKFNATMTVLVIIFPGVLYLMGPSLSLFSYAFLSTLLFSVSYTVQLFLLSRKGIQLKRCFFVNSILTLLAVALFCKVQLLS